MNKLLIAAAIIIGLGTAYYFLYQYNYHEAKDAMSMVMPDNMLAYGQIYSNATKLDDEYYQDSARLAAYAQQNLIYYENKDYGFNIGYPSTNWTIREYSLLPNQVVVFEGPQSQEIFIIVTPLEGAGNLTIQEIMKRQNYDPYDKPDPTTRVIEIGNTTIGSFPAHYEIYYESNIFKQAKAKEILASINNANGDIYSISYTADPGYFNTTYIDEMIKTFQVIS